MRLFRPVFLVLLALLVPLSAATLHAQFGISINVGFAPPALPVYEQPPCPEVNLMWTPGYWGYDNDGGYYWVPGAWVPAPYDGALWTPPYWGWNNGQYGFHDGYWGQTVGYYGGVNYGFGFGGVGFAGGEWRGGSFAYNTAVTQVNVNIIHTTYRNTTIVQQGIVANPNHVAFNGGPGGIQHTATPREQAAEKQPHTAATSFQTQHATTARSDKTSFAKANGGHPTNLAAAKPLAAQKTSPPAGMKAVPMAEPRTETKAAAPKAEPRTETKAAAPKAEPRTETKAAAPRAEPKPAAHPAAAAKPVERSTEEPKTEARPVPAEKAAPKAAPRPAVEPKAAPRPAP